MQYLQHYNMFMLVVGEEIIFVIKHFLKPFSAGNMFAKEFNAFQEQ